MTSARNEYPFPRITLISWGNMCDEIDHLRANQRPAPKPRLVHLSSPSFHWTACGVPADTNLTTSVPDKVTCRSCRRTVKFKRAL